MNDDIQAIRNLVYSYPELFDQGDFDAAVTLFEYATVRVAGSDHEFRGDTVRSLLTDRVQLHEGSPHTRHLTTNLIIEIDSDGQHATARSYYVAQQRIPDFPLQPILAGRWIDRLEKVSDKWRFVERVIHPDLIGDIGKHIHAPG